MRKAVEVKEVGTVARGSGRAHDHKPPQPHAAPPFSEMNSTPAAPRAVPMAPTVRTWRDSPYQLAVHHQLAGGGEIRGRNIHACTVREKGKADLGSL